VGVVFEKLGTTFAQASRTANACSPLLSISSLRSDQFIQAVFKLQLKCVLYTSVRICAGVL